MLLHVRSRPTRLLLPGGSDGAQSPSVESTTGERRDSKFVRSTSVMSMALRIRLKNASKANVTQHGTEIVL